MSEQTESPSASPASGSLADRIAARRSVLQAQKPETFDVPGYEGVLAATYHPLDWKSLRGINKDNEKEQDEALRELYIAADTLLRACDDMLEVAEDGSRTSLKVRWGVRLAETLDVKVPDGATARQALFAFFPMDTRMMTHYSDVMEWMDGKTAQVNKKLVEDFTTTQ